MDDDQTCPESVLLVAMERAFRGPEYTGTQTRDWQPHMKRVLQCVRENDPTVAELQKEIERLRNDMAATTGLLVRANEEIERLTTVLADRERYWKHVIRNYESTASSLRQVVAAQHQQITAMMPSCGKE